jgi:hypothetical protein
MMQRTAPDSDSSPCSNVFSAPLDRISLRASSMPNGLLVGRSKEHIKVKYFPVVVDSRTSRKSKCTSRVEREEHLNAPVKGAALIIQSLFPFPSSSQEHINPIDVSVAVESCRVAFALQIDIKSLCRIKKNSRTFMNTKLSPFSLSFLSSLLVVVAVVDSSFLAKRYKRNFCDKHSPRPSQQHPHRSATLHSISISIFSNQSLTSSNNFYLYSLSDLIIESIYEMCRDEGAMAPEKSPRHNAASHPAMMIKN